MTGSTFLCITEVHDQCIVKEGIAIAIASYLPSTFQDIDRFVEDLLLLYHNSDILLHV